MRRHKGEGAAFDVAPPAVRFQVRWVLWDVRRGGGRTEAGDGDDGDGDGERWNWLWMKSNTGSISVSQADAVTPACGDQLPRHWSLSSRSFSNVFVPPVKMFLSLFFFHLFEINNS